ncbi:hypothetical protein D3C80_1306180 [compost metagenome]
MIGKPHAFSKAHIIKECVQPAFSSRLRIQVTQGSGSSVARVLERIGSACIVIGQHGQIHNALALHFNPAFLKRNGQRNGFDRLNLGKDTFTGYPVPPGRSLYKLAVLISQVKGQTVKLQLHRITRLWQRGIRILRVIVIHQLQDTGVPAPQLFDILRLIQAPQRRKVPVRGKSLQQLSPHTLGWGIREHHTAFCFKLNQPVIEHIIFLVAD